MIVTIIILIISAVIVIIIDAINAKSNRSYVRSFYKKTKRETVYWLSMSIYAAPLTNRLRDRQVI
jgi:hypothetical protein